MVGTGEPKAIISSCPECAEKSREGSLKEYNISLEETVVLCDNSSCCYMNERSQVKEPPDKDNAHQGKDDWNDLLSSFHFDDLLDESANLPSAQETSDILSLIPTQDAFDLLPQSPMLDITPVIMVADNPTPRSPINMEESKPTPPVPVLVSNSSSNSHTPLDNVNIAPSHYNEDGNVNNNSSEAANSTSLLDLISTGNTLSTPSLLPMTTSVVSAECINSAAPFIMLWANIDALCWLDVLLCMLCHNSWVRALAGSLPYSSIVKKLLLAYKESQSLIEPLQNGDSMLLQRVMNDERPAVKLGGGHCMDISLSLSNISKPTKSFSSQDINSAKRKVHLAHIKLECVREEIWQTIEPSLRCERGKNDSPLFAFPLIINPDAPLSDLFLTEFNWQLDCSVCKHHAIHRSRGHIITFPKVLELDMNGCMVHEVACYKCQAPNQRRRLNITRRSSNLVIHFTEGLPHSDMTSLTFTSADSTSYAVSAVIEYRTCPNHFTLWQRYVQSTRTSDNWMCYDDLRSQYAQFSRQRFDVPSHNIHIVFWEAISSIGNQSPLQGSVDVADTVAHTPDTRAEPKKTPVIVSKGPVKRRAVANNNSVQPGATSSNKPKSISPIKSATVPSPTVSDFSAVLCGSDPQRKPDDNMDISVNITQSRASVSPTPSVPHTVGAVSSHVLTHPKSSPKKTTLFAQSKVPAVAATLNSSNHESKAVNPGATSSANETVFKMPHLTPKLSYGKATSLIKRSSKGDLSSISAFNHSRTYQEMVDSVSKSNDMGNTPTPLHKFKHEAQAKSKQPAAPKSYLDLVKPLLQKSKEQKGALSLSGYVPKGKRNSVRSPAPDLDDISAKKKRVMFTAETSTKTKSRKKIQALPPVIQQETARPEPAPLLSPPRSTKSRKNYTHSQHIVENFVSTVKANTVVAVKDPEQDCSDDMPSLDDMFNGLF